jgi:hypothetical protein
LPSISTLPNSLTSATLAADDLTVTVDTSASETKKLTVANLLGGMVTQAFYDYADLATQSTALSLTASTWTDLPNDGAGSGTTTTFKLPGVNDVWDTTDDELDLSGLTIGDTVDVRVDIEVTTTSANQIVNLRLNFNNGGTAFQLPFYQNGFKTAASHPIVQTVPFYIGAASVKDNPITIQIESDDTASVVINGWMIRVLPRHPVLGV